MFIKNTSMFYNKSKKSTLSIITQGIDFTGEVNTEGDIHIDGSMKGTIKANEVVIGHNGNFEGEIISNILIVINVVIIIDFHHLKFHATF